MATKFKRLTFVVTPDIEVLLNSAKKSRFYNHSRSAMIRELILAGLNSKKSQKTED